MKDITIFENFINDEELEEARQLIGEESLNLHNKDLGYPELNRIWHFVPEDNNDKKVLFAFIPESIWPLFDIETIIPSAKKFILKIKNRIDKYTNTNFNAIEMRVKPGTKGA